MSTSELNSDAKQDEWSAAAEHAQEAAVSASAMVSHLGSAVGILATQAAGEIGKQTDELAHRAGVGVQAMSDRLEQCCPDSGMLSSASHSIAHVVRGGGEYLEEAKLSGMTADVATVIRKNPLTAILIAVGLGWCVGRKFRS